MIGRIFYVAILSVALVVATMTSAPAQQGWNLYSGYTSLPTISFAGGPMSPSNPATVNLAVGATSSPIPFVMDTGSTGIVVSSNYFNTTGAQLIGPGSQTYTSSGVVDTGNFYLTNVVIYNGNAALATARVTVLDVTYQGCLTGYSSCTPNSNPQNIAYMGVGFDRGASSTQPPAPNNNTNPFINIVSLASGRPISTLAPGYIITNSGVTLGLSSSTTNGFAFVKLLPDTTNNPPQPAPAWLQAPVTIAVGGQVGSGMILPDTGIKYAYLTPPPGASITTTTTNPLCNTNVCLQSGNKIQVYLPGQTTPQPASYTFTTGDTTNALVPTTVSVVPGSSIFLNTGRALYQGFDYIYDPINGYVGYRWNGTVGSAFGQVTPSVALIGNVNLPAGFGSSLPTILYGPTTLLGAGSATFFGTISGSFDLTIGSGQIALTGANTYSGATTVNGGTLEVDGLIANTSSVTVNAGGTLSGTGTVDPTTTTITSGGTLAPGNAANPTGTLTIVGNLAFQSGAIYLVTLSRANAANTNVTGTVALAGNLQGAAGAGGALMMTYDVLHAAGGLSGAFSGISVTNYNATLSYTATDVFLNVTGAALGAGTALNRNQQNVANVISNSFNSTGALPPSFGNLFSLTGAPLANTLSQLDGEAATGAERAAFQLTNAFLALMLDPFVNGRGNGGGGTAGGPPLGFAPDEQASLPRDVALAYASILKEAPPKPIFDQRWTAWGSAYGGANNAKGDPAAGSNNMTAAAYGFAAGMDYHVTPDTVAGFALAGAGTNWGLSNALGTGRSDALQAGAYGISWFGPAYVAGALSFSNHWFTTGRSALDDLSANFIGESYGARLEGGYRVGVLPTFAVTPYGAVQFQDFYTPAYSENDLTGGGFGLSYAAMNATDVRTELGSRFDAPTLVYGKPLVLYGRVAWAHDFVNNPTLSAAFETLPGAGFTVFGAPIPHDSALTTAGAQLFLTTRWTLIAKLDGEFGNGSQTYSGSGTLRYTW